MNDSEGSIFVLWNDSCYVKKFQLTRDKDPEDLRDT